MLDPSDRVRYHEFVAGGTASQDEAEALRAKIAALEAALATTTETLTKTTATLSHTSAELAAVTAERDKLRRAYELLKGQLELLRRRIFVAKAERIDTTQLEIEFAETKAKLDRLAKVIDQGPGTDSSKDATQTSDGGDAPGGRSTGKRKSKGSGRPNLQKLDLPEERVEILDPAALRVVPLRSVATCRWVVEHQTGIITGATGTGKSYLACALAHQACRKGFRVFYRRVPRLFDELRLATSRRRDTRLLARIAKVDVLVLDSCGVPTYVESRSRPPRGPPSWSHRTPHNSAS